MGAASGGGDVSTNVTVGSTPSCCRQRASRTVQGWSIHTLLLFFFGKLLTRHRRRANKLCMKSAHNRSTPKNLGCTSLITLARDMVSQVCFLRVQKQPDQSHWANLPSNLFKRYAEVDTTKGGGPFQRASKYFYCMRSLALLAIQRKMIYLYIQ